MTEAQLKNIVAFCALMQNGSGIVDKSPDYVIEKFTKYCESPTDATPWGLDDKRLKIVNEWEQKWRTNRDIYQRPTRDELN